MKTKRNAPCPCGSGKKYKHCCLQYETHDNIIPFPTEPNLAEEMDEVMQEALFDAELDGLGVDFDYESFIAQSESYAEFKKREEQIIQACTTLERHHRKYEKLKRNDDKLFKRLQKLFSEPSFDDIRFSIEELDDLHELYGVTDLLSLPLDEFAELSEDMLFDKLMTPDCLLETHFQLVCLIPEYTTRKRYLDACIIEDFAAALMDENDDEDNSGFFLKALFLQSLIQRARQKRTAIEGLVEKLGLPIEEFLKMDPKEGQQFLFSAMDDPKKRTIVEEFAEKHGRELLDNERDIVARFFEREESRQFLLPPGPLEPFIDEHLAKIIKIVELDENAETFDPDALLDHEEEILQVMIETSRKIAKTIFTPERITSLIKKIKKYQRQIPKDDRQHISDVEFILQRLEEDNAPPDQNYFLTTLSLASFQQVGEIEFEEDR